MQEGRGVAGRSILRAQNWRRVFNRRGLGQWGRLWLNHREGIRWTLRKTFAVLIALSPIISERTVWSIALEPFALRTLLPFRSVLTLGAFLTFALRPIPLRTVALRVPVALLAGFAVTVTAKITVTVATRLVLAALTPLVLTRVLARLLLTVIGTLIGSLVLARLLVADLSLLRLGLIVAVLIFEVDVEAGGNRITPEDFRRRPMGLHSPQKPEIVLGMLQVVLGQNPVSGRRSVTGQLLVLFEDVLRMAPDLDPIRAIGFEGPVGILLRLATAAAIATAGPTAATLPLHSFEISHVLSVTWFAGTPERPRRTL